MGERSALTPTPVLGFVPVAGVSATLSTVVAAGWTVAGLATPKAHSWAGSPPQVCAGQELSRGKGPSAKKSFALLFVSRQPSCFLVAARRFEVAAVGPVPSKQLALLP